jgi:hypothetical protein
MKNTTRMTLRSALYTVLLSSSTMLAAADGRGETPGPAAVTPSSPGIDQRAQAKPPGGPMILGDTQLDEIKAGQELCVGAAGLEACAVLGILGG